jgi:Ni/Co efflux regulator RcnB
MKKTISKISWIGLLTAAAMLFFLPMTTYAQDHGHDRDNHRGHNEHRDADHHERHDMDHGRKERVVVRHDDYREVVVKDRHYFYRGGAFYDRGPGGYVVVTAPIGARITVLPGGYRVIRHHRVRYYFFGGIYYKFVPSEHVYMVVSAPF